MSFPPANRMSEVHESREKPSSDAGFWKSVPDSSEMSWPEKREYLASRFPGCEPSEAVNQLHHNDVATSRRRSSLPECSDEGL